MSMDKKVEHIIWNYLEGTITSSERVELSSWLKKSEDNRKMFLSYYNLWNLSQQSKFDSKDALKRMHRLIQSRGVSFGHKNPWALKKTYYMWTAVVAASLIFAISFWSLKNYQDTSNDIREFAASHMVAMNKDSEIQFLLTDKKMVTVPGKEVIISCENGMTKVNNEKVLQKQGFNELIVPHGRRGIVTLMDGTKIWVNSGTRMIYPTKFSKDKREVFVDGEIYLEVAHNSQKPFIVKTNKINVTVTGTKFNISTDNVFNETNVALLEGGVNIEAVKSKALNVKYLTPNHIYTLSAKHEETIKKVDAAQYVTWVNYVFECDDLSMKEIFSQLKRIYGATFICTPEVNDFHYSGKFSTKVGLDSILNNIAQILPIVSTLGSDGVYYISLNQKE